MAWKGKKLFWTIYDNPANTTQFKEISTVTSLQNLIISWSYKYKIHFHTHSTSLNVIKVHCDVSQTYPAAWLCHNGAACFFPCSNEIRVLHCAVLQHHHWKHQDSDMSLTVTSLSVPWKRCTILQNQWNLDWFLQCRLILSFTKNSVHS